MDLKKFRSMRQKPGVLALSVKDMTAELLIYDIVGEDWYGEGLTAKSVVQEIAALPPEVDTITVRINSPGGDVFDGVGILNALLAFRGTVNVQIDSLCASIASVIAMAGKRITMAETAMLMIHNPWTIEVGDANDFLKAAETLNQVRAGTMLPAYARSGLSQEQIIAIMDAETWYTAAQAKEAGWVDAITELPAKAGAHAKYDLSAFKHAPVKSLGDENEPENTLNLDEIATKSAENAAKGQLVARSRARSRELDLRLAEVC